MLLVSTTMGNARASMGGTGIGLGSHVFCFYAYWANPGIYSLIK